MYHASQYIALKREKRSKKGKGTEKKNTWPLIWVKESHTIQCTQNATAPSESKAQISVHSTTRSPSSEPGPVPQSPHECRKQSCEGTVAWSTRCPRRPALQPLVCTEPPPCQFLCHFDSRSLAAQWFSKGTEGSCPLGKWDLAKSGDMSDCPEQWVEEGALLSMLPWTGSSSTTTKEGSCPKCQWRQGWETQWAFAEDACFTERDPDLHPKRPGSINIPSHMNTAHQDRNPFMKISLRSFLAGSQHYVPDPEGGGQHSPGAPATTLLHPMWRHRSSLRPLGAGWPGRGWLSLASVAGAHAYSFRPLLSSHSVHSSFCPYLWAITAPFYPRHRNNFCFQKTRL